MSSTHKPEDETQIINDAIALVKSRKEITYLNLILKLNHIDPQKLATHELSLIKAPNNKTYTFNVGDQHFQVAEFIVNLMAKEWREANATKQKA